MRKALGIFFILVVVGVLFSGSALAESHKFRLLNEATLAGVQLAPGNYRIEFEGEQALVYRGKKLVVETKAEVQPLDKGVSPNSVKIESGEIREIRLKKECVMFVG